MKEPCTQDSSTTFPLKGRKSAIKSATTDRFNTVQRENILAPKSANAEIRLLNNNGIIEQGPGPLNTTNNNQQGPGPFNNSRPRT